jgi:hypothetical protein
VKQRVLGDAVAVVDVPFRAAHRVLIATIVLAFRHALHTAVATAHLLEVVVVLVVVAHLLPTAHLRLPLA